MSRDDMAINRGQAMNLTNGDRSNLDVLEFICWDGKNIPERRWLEQDSMGLNRKGIPKRRGL